MFLKNSQNSWENGCYFIKKETLAQVLSREFCEIFKNAFVYGTLPVDYSVKWNKILERVIHRTGLRPLLTHTSKFCVEKVVGENFVILLMECILLFVVTNFPWFRQWCLIIFVFHFEIIYYFCLLRSDSHVWENFCQIEIFLKNTIICSFGV